MSTISTFPTIRFTEISLLFFSLLYSLIGFAPRPASKNEGEADTVESGEINEEIEENTVTDEDEIVRF